MSEPLITRPIADFLALGLNLYIGTRDDALVPSIGSGLTIFPNETGTGVTVGMAVPQNTRVLADLRKNGAIAISCGYPPDDRTLQIKGRTTSITEVTDPADIERMTRYLELATANLIAVGIPLEIILRARVTPAVKVEVEVTQIFEQTPGPKAGEPITRAGPVR